ncbi:MAG: hypothetical protein H6821_17325 [Planctomycetaceae bacterium]|nr:hypothetical protein [Planctomycetaceae bacterium]
MVAFRQLSSKCIAAPFVATAMLLTTISVPSRSHAQSPEVVRTVLKLVAVVSGAKAAEEAGIGLEEYWNETAKPGTSIYSITFDFDEGVWADWFSGPDIFAVVEYEGGRKVLIPDIEYNWDYSLKSYTIRCPTMPVGSTCVVRLYDDDAISNTVWKTILSNKVDWTVSSHANAQFPRRGTVALGVDAVAGGTFKILDLPDGQSAILDGPDSVAIATFSVPDEPSTSTWSLQGNFTHNGKNIGNMSFKHWYTNDTPIWIGYLLRPKLLFWAVIVLGLGVVLIASRAGRSGNADDETKES